MGIFNFIPLRHEDIVDKEKEFGDAMGDGLFVFFLPFRSGPVGREIHRGSSGDECGRG